MADKETKHGTLLDPLLPGDLIGVQRVPDEIHYKATLSGLSAVVGGGGGGFSFNQTAHGFVVGDAISKTTTPFVKADADAGPGMWPCHAIVSAVTNDDNFIAQTSGFMAWTAHGLPTLGATYYLSTTAGEVVTPKPGVPGQIIQRVLVAVTVDLIIITIGEAWT